MALRHGRVIFLNRSVHRFVNLFGHFNQFTRTFNGIKRMVGICLDVIFGNTENGYNLVAHGFIEYAAIFG